MIQEVVYLLIASIVLLIAIYFLGGKIKKLSIGKGLLEVETREPEPDFKIDIGDVRMNSQSDPVLPENPEFPDEPPNNQPASPLAVVEVGPKQEDVEPGWMTEDYIVTLATQLKLCAEPEDTVRFVDRTSQLAKDK